MRDWDVPELKELEYHAGGVEHTDFSIEEQWNLVKAFYVGRCKPEKPEVPLAREKCTVEKDKGGGYALVMIDVEGRRTTFSFT